MNKCKIFERCGNCQLLHLNYEDSVAYKEKEVSNLFKKAKINHPIDQVITSPKPFAYRNKMNVAFQYKNGKLIHGFFEENTHQVVSLDECLIHTSLQNKIAEAIKDMMIEMRLPAYDEDRRTGLLRYAIIREGVFSKQILVVLVVGSEIFPGRSEFVKRLRSRFPAITSIVQNLNNRKTSIVLGEKEMILYGKGYIEDNLDDFVFRITSKSFYQINPIQTLALYHALTGFLESKQEIILDAYSGVGTIGMFLSKKARQVVCVENNPQAVKAGIAALKENKIRNVEFVMEDATLFLEKSKQTISFSTIVLDPPRSGATESFLKACLYDSPDHIIYVSCEPNTLIRDLHILLEKYQIKKVVLVDMFCWTKHIETVVLLSLK